MRSVYIFIFKKINKSASFLKIYFIDLSIKAAERLLLLIFNSNTNSGSFKLKYLVYSFTKKFSLVVQVGMKRLRDNVPPPSVSRR